MGAHDEDESTEGARSFARFMDWANSGALNSDASHELHRFLGDLRTRAMRSNGAKGTFTLTLKIALDDADQVQIEHSIKTRVPELPRRKGAAYLTRGGNLTPDNPRQQSLPLTDVSRPERPVVDLAGKPRGGAA